MESDVRKIVFIFRRRQLPVIHDSAFTADNSQGQTILESGIIYLLDVCFSHGKLYVENSKATHPSQLQYFIKDSAVGIRNGVLKQLLRRKNFILDFKVYNKLINLIML